MFFLHHAVRHSVAKENETNLLLVQMIDKIWYDWQLRDARNRNVFGGGSISWQFNPSQSSTQYPNGAPPWLNVCILQIIRRT
jgi:hypothetical protein